MRIARVAQRDGIDLIDVPRDERGKSFLRAVLDVFLQQNAVVQFQHLQVNAADQGKVTASGRKKLSSNHSNSSSTSPAKSVGAALPPRRLSETQRPAASRKATFACTLLALFRKSLIINGAGEGNRTLVIIHGTPVSSNGCNPVAWDTFRFGRQVKGDFRVHLPGKKIFKIAVDTFAHVVHIHITISKELDMATVEN